VDIGLYKITSVGTILCRDWDVDMGVILPKVEG